MLNAFRHQRESHGARVGVGWTVGSVLNAFRHQRESHALPDPGEYPPRCAQRLSASKRIAQCGTWSISGKNPGAQRLSASKRIALTDGTHIVEAGPVLNAFRHQRESHLSAPHGSTVGRGAQRLSASKRIALNGLSPLGDLVYCAQRLSASKRIALFDNRITEPKTAVGSESAQRLSASKRIAPPAQQRSEHITAVLNAFRHQRESHAVRMRTDCALTRAQRLSASKRIALGQRVALEIAYLCSTPFGIKENRTSTK